MPEPTQAARDLAHRLSWYLDTTDPGAVAAIDVALAAARQAGRDDIYQAMGRVVHRARITDTVQKAVNPQWGARDDRRTR